MNGDLSLIRGVQGIRQAQEVLAEDHPARQVGEHGKAIKKLGKLTETNEQLGTMVDRAVKLVTKPEIRKTSGLLTTFLFEECSTFLTMQCKGMTIKRQAVTTKREEVAITRNAANKKREDTELGERQVVSREKCFQLTEGG